MPEKPYKSRYSVPLPAGFNPPEGAGADGVFTTTDDWRVEGDRICLVQLGDHKIPESEHEDKGEKKPGWQDMAEGVVNDLKGTPEAQGMVSQNNEY